MAFCKSEKDPRRQVVLMTAPKEMGLGPDEVLPLEKYAYGEDEAPFI